MLLKVKIILKKINKIIESIENANFHFGYYLLSIFFVIFLRIFLESFSDTDYFFNFYTHVHFILFYLVIIQAFIFLIRIVANTSFKKILNIVSFSFGLILLPPIIDIILSDGRGMNIDYLLPVVHPDLIYRYFHFFGKFLLNGVTPGIKIEISIFLFLLFFYFLSKTKNILKSLVGLFFSYNIFFIFAITPFVLFPYCRFYDCFNSVGRVIINYFSLFSIVLAIILFFIFDKNKFKILAKDFRFLRQFHYILMFIFGLIIGVKQSGVVNLFSIVRPDQIIISVLAIIFGLLFSLITNNIVDYDIDQVSNINRPLVGNKIDLGSYSKLAWIFFALSLFFASLNGYKILFYEILFIGNYFLYSMPPFRLKRIFFFSKLLISLNSLILVFMGYSYFFSDLKTFPRLIMLIFLVGLTAAIQFIDLKDYEGDKKEGIKTLPVVLGLKNAKLIMGIFLFVNYLLFNLVVENIYFFAISFLAGLLQFYFVNKKDYKEKPIFVLYLLSIIVFMAFYCNF